ncbi:hypothetical protein, partial [Curtobacterium sp. MMLR14_014]
GVIAEAEDRLAAIRTEREAVAGYLENLRGVLTNATGLLGTAPAAASAADAADDVDATDR